MSASVHEDKMQTIRNIEDHELPELLEMIQELAAHHGDAATVTLADLRREVGTWFHIRAAQHHGRLVGYTALLPLGQLQFGVRGMDIHHLFVRTERRATGVGKALVEDAMTYTRANGGRYIMVGTAPQNTVAQEIYKAMGFEERTESGPRFSRRLDGA
jgi:ribosomal protein S18 acetylase RimI-like enzyme